jgi:MscS family membrane protein
MRISRLLALLAVAPASLGAQFLQRPAAPESAPDTAPTVVVDSASPRAAVQRFLEASRNGDLAAAGAVLDLSAPAAAARPEELARRLKAVLDSRLWVDLDKLSPRADGDTADGLPRDREQLGTIALPDGSEVAVRLARVGRGSERRWVFAPGTVVQVDALYAALPDHWIREHLPAPLLASGPFDVLWWQWIALLILVPLSGFIGLLLGRPTRGVLRKLVSRTDTDFDDRLLAASRGPIILLLGVAVSRVLLRWVALAAPHQAFIVELQQALAVVAVFWLILRSIGVLQDTLPAAAFATERPALRSLIPLGGRIARLIVFFIAVLTVISQFGYPIATILAGLGIGGIAVALGAQKSLEHFFGSVSIGVDQPFRVGDWVIVGGVEGEVEQIGLRSTRIRTLERTVVSIPNGQLAESQTENFGARDRIRFRTMVALEYATSAATMRAVRDGIEALLRAHPLIWPDRVVVRLREFGPSSLDLEVFCWLQTTDVDQFRAGREELLLGIMGVVERHGARFAFPTRTVHLTTGARAGDQPL